MKGKSYIVHSQSRNAFISKNGLTPRFEDAEVFTISGKAMAKAVEYQSKEKSNDFKVYENPLKF